MDNFKLIKSRFDNKSIYLVFKDDNCLYKRMDQNAQKMAEK